MDRNGRRYLVLGSSGSGKSIFAEDMIKASKRLIVFDPEDAWSDLKGFEVFEDLGKMLEHLKDCWDGAFRVVYVPSARNIITDLDKISTFLFFVQDEFKQGLSDDKITLLAEELHTGFPLNHNVQKYGGFYDLCTRGRKRGINVIGVSQRPARLNPEIRGNLSGMYCFELSQDFDRKAAGGLMGDDEAYRQISALEPEKFRYVTNTEGGIVTKEPIKI